MSGEGAISKVRRALKAYRSELLPLDVLCVRRVDDVERPQVVVELGTRNDAAYQAFAALDAVIKVVEEYQSYSGPDDLGREAVLAALEEVEDAIKKELG